MQDIVVDKPYEFIPPIRSRVWPALVQLILDRYLKSGFGIESTEVRHAELLQASIQAGDGILLAPNHCRLSDPLVLGMLARKAKCLFFAMGSYHLFLQSRTVRFMVRRIGGFSVYREGLDRQAINMAIDILTEASRPLVVFPEGAISRHNDQLMSLMDGIAFMARTALKRRMKVNPAAKVVIHPVAIRYFFRGDLEESLRGVLDEIESRFAWLPKKNTPLFDRIRRVGEAGLALKEIEYFGHASEGQVFERIDHLIDHVLQPLEEEWNIKKRAGNVVARVKELRSALLPDLVNGELSESEREHRWQQLAACYYAQQLSHYPRDYVNRDNAIVEHVLETVERLEEDLTDKITLHRPLHAVIDVGPAIEVTSKRDRNATTDPVMEQLETQLQGQLDALSQEAQRVKL